MVFNKINKKFLLIVFALAMLSSSYAATAKNFVVVIDAGHGGKDAGASGPYGYEKNVTLSVALKLGRELSNIPGVTVVYTRTTDVFVELARRAQIANDYHADLFISIHCNSAHSGASGTETWVLGMEENRQHDNLSVVTRENSVIYLEDDYERTYDGFNPNSVEDVISMTMIQDKHYDNSVYLAQLVEKEFQSDLRISRGVKQSGFAVLWRTAMPSVLIEMGFISNSTEGKYICSNEGQEEIAHSIYDAFKKYKNLWDKKNQEKTIVTETKPKEKPIENGFYKIQILASNNLYIEGASQFRGLKDILTVKKGNFYKYYYGETHLNSQKEELIQLAKKKGFNSSYAVLFKDDFQYKIELFSSNKKYNTKNSLFANSPEVERIKNDSGNKYSYYTHSSYTYANALKKLKELQKSGFENAVLVNISN